MLKVQGLTKVFGGLKAVDNASVEVGEGRIVALIGPNGAGKTTLFACIAGFLPVNAGQVHLLGQDITGLPVHQIARRGMVRTFQLTKALSRMTVLENMLLAAPGQRGERLLQSLLPSSWRPQEATNVEQADALLKRFKLDHMRDQYSGTLSGGQRKLLEMARALMVEPSLVMLDEPMAGVNPALTQSLLGHIKGLRDDEGRSVVFVEHDMDVVFDISDWVVCLAQGRVIAEGPPELIGRNQAVIDAYLGATHGKAPHREKRRDRIARIAQQRADGGDA
jgi:branched-chain amino acid transport system ATP-binding protein